MFFRILKKDLKRKKSLNITIFLFIVAASALAAVDIGQIYSTSTSLDYTYKASNIGDYVVIKQDDLQQRDEIDERMQQWVQDSSYIQDASIEPMIPINFHNIEFVDSSDIHVNFKQKAYYLGAYPKKHNFVFDTEDQPFSIKDGEIAISNEIQYLTKANIGDKIRITTNKGSIYEFTLSHIFKDTLLPMGYSRASRLLLSDGDMEQLTKENKLYSSWCSFTVSKDGRTNFLSDYSNQKNFRLDEYLDTVTWKSSYDIQMSLCLTLMVVSIFLLLIVFITLWFTIVSSVQEDYSEIGMMKAVGIPKIRLKMLYLTKYTGLAVLGSMFGFGISIPCTSYLNETFSTNLIVANRYIGYGYELLVCVLIVLVIFLFCLFTVRKTDKMSVVNAIRCGKTGERFRNSSRIFLKDRKHMGMPLFMALTSLTKGIRRYIFLFAAYLLGMSILLLPFHIINSILSPEYLRYWGVVPSDFLPLDTTSLEETYRDTRTAGESATTDGFNRWCCEKMSSPEFPIKMYDSKYDFYDYYIDSENKVSVRATFDIDMDLYAYDKGSAPHLPNEIAAGAMFAKRYGLHVGSIIKMKVNDYNEDHTKVESSDKEFVITAIYETMDNNGMAVHMGTQYHSDSCWGTNVHGLRFDCDKSVKEKQERIKELQQEFGSSTICTLDEYMEHSMAKYMVLFSAMKVFLIGAVLGILFLMTYLFHNLMISKETGEIAVMKSMGIKRSRIKLWQIDRILMIAIPALFIGVQGSITIGEKLCNIIFQGYGVTSFTFIIDKITTFVIAPFILLVTILTAVLLSLLQIRNIQIHHMNEE